ncbi:MAG: hypothetical protein NTX79_07030 [Candidatus Micrarchaeota archaeon]|nr:hypothetical protein [Candidatus Micrarchaeota archaeon]
MRTSLRQGWLKNLKPPKSPAEAIARMIAALPIKYRHPLASLAVTEIKDKKGHMKAGIEKWLPGIFDGKPPDPRCDF